jgi:hypothetical protein
VKWVGPGEKGISTLGERRGAVNAARSEATSRLPAQSWDSGNREF